MSTIEKLDDLIKRMTADLHTGYTAPGVNNPAAVMQLAAAIESLVNARLRLPMDAFSQE